MRDERLNKSIVRVRHEMREKTGEKAQDDSP
jgi:hypothetical protein